MPGKVACRYCKGKFYPDRLRLHLKCATRSLALFMRGSTERARFTLQTTAALKQYIWAGVAVGVLHPLQEHAQGFDDLFGH